MEEDRYISGLDPYKDSSESKGSLSNKKKVIVIGAGNVGKAKAIALASNIEHLHFIEVEDLPEAWELKDILKECDLKDNFKKFDKSLLDENLFSGDNFSFYKPSSKYHK